MNIIRKIFFVLSAAMLIFIWGQSAIPAKLSNMESDIITKKIVKTEKVKSESKKESKKRQNEMNAMVRKVAHIAEYAAFGFFLLMAFAKIKKAHKVLIIGFWAAFFDESIQILSKRSAYVKDIWIDMAGIAIGILAALVIIFIRDKIKVKKGV